MLGVHATAVATQVVDLHALRDRADQQPIGDAVRLARPAVHAELPVAAAIPARAPLPAGVRLRDLLHEALHQRALRAWPADGGAPGVARDVAQRPALDVAVG